MSKNKELDLHSLSFVIRCTSSVSLFADSSQYQVRLCLFSRRSLLALFVVFLLELCCCLYFVRILLKITMIVIMIAFLRV